MIGVLAFIVKTASRSSSAHSFVLYECIFTTELLLFVIPAYIETGVTYGEINAIMQLKLNRGSKSCEQPWRNTYVLNFVDFIYHGNSTAFASMRLWVYDHWLLLKISGNFFLMFRALISDAFSPTGTRSFAPHPFKYFRLPRTINGDPIGAHVWNIYLKHIVWKKWHINNRLHVKPLPNCSKNEKGWRNEMKEWMKEIK